MRRNILVSCLLAFLVGAGCSRRSSEELSPNQKSGSDPANSAQQVQADVQRVLKAVYGGDTETVLEFTHPRIVEQLGGLAQAKRTLQGTLDQFEAAGIKVESLTFPAPPTFTNSATHEFVVVPTKLVIIAKEQRVESLNYQFGIREFPQTNWAYIEGSRITADNVSKFFPDFPAGFEFPTVYRKKL